MMWSPLSIMSQRKAPLRFGSIGPPRTIEAEKDAPWATPGMRGGSAPEPRALESDFIPHLHSPMGWVLVESNQNKRARMTL